MELLLNLQLVHGVQRFLVRWRGNTSADATWLRLDEPAHCPEKVAEYDTAAQCYSTASRIARGAGPAPLPAPLPRTCAGAAAPHGARRVPPYEVLAEAALAGKAVLYLWPAEGWVRGTVARRSRPPRFSHVMRSALGSAVTPSTPPRRARPVVGCPLFAPRGCGFPWLPFSGTTVMRRADLWSVISLSISAGRGSNILHRGTTERTRPGARAHYGRGSRQA